MPAFAAGVSSIGEITRTAPLSLVIWIPKPPNAPCDLSVNSLKSSFDRYEECGSKADNMPFIAPSNIFLSSASSTNLSRAVSNTKANFFNSE